MKIVTTKSCCACRKKRPAVAFNKNMAHADGLDSLCRGCRMAYGRETYGYGSYRWSCPRLNLRPMELGYIAGMLDGEGHIRLRYSNGQWSLETAIANTHRPVLDWIKKRIGGVVVSKAVKNPRAKPCWAWRASVRLSLRLLQSVGPALKIKRRHAQLALLFYRKIPAYKVIHRGALPEHPGGKLEALYLELKRLNRRGPPLV